MLASATTNDDSLSINSENDVDLSSDPSVIVSDPNDDHLSSAGDSDQTSDLRQEQIKISKQTDDHLYFDSHEMIAKDGESLDFLAQAPIQDVRDGLSYSEPQSWEQVPHELSLNPKSNSFSEVNPIQRITELRAKLN